MTNALVQNKTFQSVDISVKCPISNETGNAMAETLKHNLTLTALANPAPLQPQKFSWRTLRSQKAQPYKNKNSGLKLYRARQTRHSKFAEGTSKFVRQFWSGLTPAVLFGFVPFLVPRRRPSHSRIAPKGSLFRLYGKYYGHTAMEMVATHVFWHEMQTLLTVANHSLVMAWSPSH